MATNIVGATGIDKVQDGIIVNADIDTVAASKLTGTIADARFPATLPATSAANLTAIPAANITGTLPAIDGSSLTGVASYRPNAQPIIINGDMRIAQRSVSETSITSEGYYTVDRWQQGISSGGTWTITRSTDVPTAEGFTSSLKLDNTATSTSSSMRVRHKYILEGQDLQLLKKGTAQAEATTVAFWVKSTKTGTFVCAMADGDNARYCAQQYTVSSSDTWEKKVINFPADTTGALANDNGSSLTINFGIAAGTNYTSGTLHETWSSYANADMFVGQVNCADSTSNNFLLTGVQLEIGTFTSSTIPPFQHESYGASLARCQRYYHEIQSAFISHAANGFIFNLQFPVTMRATPSQTHSYNSVANDVYKISDAATPTFVPNGIFMDVNGLKQGYDFDGGYTDAEGYVTDWVFDAEL